MKLRALILNKRSEVGHKGALDRGRAGAYWPCIGNPAGSFFQKKIKINFYLKHTYFEPIYSLKSLTQKIIFYDFFFNSSLNLSKKLIPILNISNKLWKINKIFISRL